MKWNKVCTHTKYLKLVGVRVHVIDKYILDADSSFLCKFTKDNFNCHWVEWFINVMLFFYAMINTIWFIMAFYKYCSGLLKR